jgi:Fe-S cluster assembly iron-binding protein IscA
MTDNPAQIPIEKELEDLIKKYGKDFRLCTTCGGPAIYPIEYSAPKESDIVMKLGGSTLYVSRVQARYLRQIEMRMIQSYLRSLR